ncbi:DUF3175 domain-containing protein [Mesorhizobium sp.]|uniref:DUF3175 domain-containing protein n=1 Tax=Mesorhizobium sp. TaxID=1871066 RepID=UPI0025EE4076|nr:DUF3175 domain-containing protein [Mesorhizobium sp.]
MWSRRFLSAILQIDRFDTTIGALAAPCSATTGKSVAPGIRAAVEQWPPSRSFPSTHQWKEFVMTAKRKRSAEVTEHSDALDLEEHIFESHDPKKIAASLKRSAEHSERRKAEPFQSAMSMLNFYINRAGKNLPAKQKKVLEDAKDELRAAFGRPREG